MAGSASITDRAPPWFHRPAPRVDAELPSESFSAVLHRDQAEAAPWLLLEVEPLAVVDDPGVACPRRDVRVRPGACRAPLCCAALATGLGRDPQHGLPLLWRQHDAVRQVHVDGRAVAPRSFPCRVGERRLSGSSPVDARAPITRRDSSCARGMPAQDPIDELGLSPLLPQEPRVPGDERDLLRESIVYVACEPAPLLERGGLQPRSSSRRRSRERRRSAERRRSPDGNTSPV